MNGRDHGGGVDAAIARWGGTRDEWIDLSTGINPNPYPLPELPLSVWQALPDRAATERLEQAARAFWSVPEGAAVLATPGLSALIARMPAALGAPGAVQIPTPTYNEHAAAFARFGWKVRDAEANAPVQVVVHPNNPDGRLWPEDSLRAPTRIVDESFCDTTPEASLIAKATEPGTLILKGLGKFWGLAGLRLGVAIGDPALIAALSEELGPWPVSGPALRIGACALADDTWAQETRARVETEAARLDALMIGAGAQCAGGTSLFRLYSVENATAWQARLAGHRILTRIFPYSQTWIRLGLPPEEGWPRLEAALC